MSSSAELEKLKRSFISSGSMGFGFFTVALSGPCQTQILAVKAESLFKVAERQIGWLTPGILAFGRMMQEK